jgi:hypothetical protein
LNSPILTAQDREVYLSSIEMDRHGMLDKEDFINTEAWFDPYESIDDEQ